MRRAAALVLSGGLVAVALLLTTTGTVTPLAGGSSAVPATEHPGSSRPAITPSSKLVGLVDRWQVVGADGDQADLVLAATARRSSVSAVCTLPGEPQSPSASDVDWEADGQHLLLLPGRTICLGDLPGWFDAVRSYQWLDARRVQLLDEAGRPVAVMTGGAEHRLPDRPGAAPDRVVPAAQLAGTWLPDPPAGQPLPAEEIEFGTDSTWVGGCGNGRMVLDRDGVWLGHLAADIRESTNQTCTPSSASTWLPRAHYARLTTDRLVLLDAHRTTLGTLHRRAAGTAGQPRCRASELRLADDPGFNLTAYTGEHPRGFLLTNVGSRPCVVQGVVGARLTDEHGQPAPLRFRIGGYEHRHYPTGPLLLRPGWAAALIVDRFRCDVSSRVLPGTFAVTLPTTGTVRGPATFTVCGPQEAPTPATPFLSAPSLPLSAPSPATAERRPRSASSSSKTARSSRAALAGAASAPPHERGDNSVPSSRKTDHRLPTSFVQDARCCRAATVNRSGVARGRGYLRWSGRGLLPRRPAGAGA